MHKKRLMNTDTKILNLMAELDRCKKDLESLPDKELDGDLTDKVLAHIQNCKMALRPPKVIK